MEAAQAILSIWQVTSEAHHEFWTYYLLVASAALGFGLSDTYRKLAPGIRICVPVLWVTFVVANASAMLGNLAIYNATVAALGKMKHESLSSIVDAIASREPLLVMGLHGLADALVLITLLLAGGFWPSALVETWLSAARDRVKREPRANK